MLRLVFVLPAMLGAAGCGDDRDPDDRMAAANELALSRLCKDATETNLYDLPPLGAVFNGTRIDEARSIGKVVATARCSDLVIVSRLHVPSAEEVLSEERERAGLGKYDLTSSAHNEWFQVTRRGTSGPTMWIGATFGPRDDVSALPTRDPEPMNPGEPATLVFGPPSFGRPGEPCFLPGATPGSAAVPITNEGPGTGPKRFTVTKVGGGNPDVTQTVELLRGMEPGETVIVQGSAGARLTLSAATSAGTSIASIALPAESNLICR